MITAAIMDSKLFPALLIFALTSPFVAVAVASVLFARHRGRIAPERRMPVIRYVMAVVVFGALGGYAGLFLGVAQACPGGGNLCGLWGVFVTGPLAAAAAILAVGSRSRARRAERRSGGRNRAPSSLVTAGAGAG